MNLIFKQRQELSIMKKEELWD